MIQPRLSATWAYNGKDTVFASYARYNPAASSLPRAASWDRNLAVTQNADFDANGNLFAVESVASSTGKLFVPDMTPRRYDEFLFGTARQFTTALVGPRLLPLPQGHALLGGHATTRARRVYAPPATVPGTDVVDSADARTSRTCCDQLDADRHRRLGRTATSSPSSTARSPSTAN